MRRLNLVFLASLQLCRALQPSFSIHDDLLAYPQFEIVFSNSHMSEAEALALIERAHPTYSADFSSQTDLTNQIRESSANDANGGHIEAEDGASQISETYEIMNFPPLRYLCCVPVLAPPEEQNKTATDLAKAEEARELARAATKGWELMNGLEGECLYFMSGWWSYSFCYGKEIVQFHALPRGLTTPNSLAPVRDPQSLEYVLGRVPELDGPHRHSNPNQRQGYNTIDDQRVIDETSDAVNDASSPPTSQPPNSELAVKDHQRYLVQRLDGGTICDLTGRERTIEVQYHCHPGVLTDRIGWIKEVNTCTYLMVVHTNRLCHDVAFMPPKEGRAHPITCHRIGDGEEGSDSGFLGIKGKEASEGVIAAGTAAAGHVAEVIMNAAAEAIGNVKGALPVDQAQKGERHTGQNIGGVVIGGRAMLEDGTRLPPPRNHMGAQLNDPAKTVRHLLARGKGKKQVESLTREQLKKMDLDPKTIDSLRESVQELAGDDEWTLELVEAPGEIAEIRGIVGPGEGQQEYVQAKTKEDHQNAQAQAKQDKLGKKPAKGKRSDEDQGEQGDNEETGSEETFKYKAEEEG